MAKSKTGFTFTNPENLKENTHNIISDVGYEASKIPDKLKGMYSNLASDYESRKLVRRAMGIPTVAWDAGSGLSLVGKNVGKYVPYVAGGISAVQSLKSLDDLNDVRQDTSSLINDILISASGNPYAPLDLTSEQRSLLRKLRNSSDTPIASMSDIDLLSTLKGAGVGAVLGGVGGGIPGAVAGAIGGGTSSSLEGLSKAQSDNNAQLEALYTALKDSETRYNVMRKQKLYADR